MQNMEVNTQRWVTDQTARVITLWKKSVGGSTGRARRADGCEGNEPKGHGQDLAFFEEEQYRCLELAKIRWAYMR